MYHAQRDTKVYPETDRTKGNIRMSRNHKALIELKNMGYPLANIRRAMCKLTGMSHPQIAQNAGCPRIAITHTIIGLRSTPDLQEKIAKAFDVPASEMFKNG